LKETNISVLLASLDVRLESKERSALFPRVAAAMDRTLAMTEGFLLTEPPRRQEHQGHYRSSWRTLRLGGLP
jgi:hypothetical protein